jgi:hypothetical protein
MTEAEWLACTEVGPMLAHLGDDVSPRKLRLFACACCRRIWYLMQDELIRKVVRIAEQHADGRAGVSRLRRVTVSAEGVAEGMEGAVWSAAKTRVMAAAAALGTTLSGNGIHSARCAASAVSCATVVPPFSAEAAKTAEEAAQAGLLRCIFQAFPTVALDPAWLTWNDGAVGRLAQSAYDERAFDRLPVLADALEDAGCADTAILGHCRGPGPHARGCWVVDLLLGKS